MYIGNRQAEALCSRVKDGLALFALAYIPRRSVDRDDDVSALLNELFDGITGIAATFPILLVVPEVFADGERDSRASNGADGLAVSGLKIACFVEDVIGRQQHFALIEDDVAVLDHSSGVLGLDCGVFRRS